MSTCQYCNQEVSPNNSAIKLHQGALGLIPVTGDEEDYHIYPTPICKGSYSRRFLIEKHEEWREAYESMGGEFFKEDK